MLRISTPFQKQLQPTMATYEADILMIALGADYDIQATPGLAEGGHEFYSINGAERLREVLPTFSKGKVIVGVCSAPFKCPPAPSEAALLMHDYLVKRGIRNDCEISIVMPFGLPIPPSPDSSKALLAAFAERNIKFIGKHLFRLLTQQTTLRFSMMVLKCPMIYFLEYPNIVFRK